MTSRERRVDQNQGQDQDQSRSIVFDRDEYTCQHCGQASDDASLRALAVDDLVTGSATKTDPNVATESGHVSTFTTVCAPCAAVLDGDGTTEGAVEQTQEIEKAISADTEAPMTSEQLFTLVRETTQQQGETVSDVAAFASLTTTLPAKIADAGAANNESKSGSTVDDSSETDSEDSEDSENSEDTERVEANPTTALAETAQQFVATRRSLLLAIASVDQRLTRLDELEYDAATATGDTNPGDQTPAFAAFLETATELQETLRGLVSLAEQVTAGLGRCHGCFGGLSESAIPVTPTACPTCGRTSAETSEWQQSAADSTTVDFERLFSALNDALREASATTERLTDRTTALATELVAAQ
ncbi:hypothetical protein C482_00340 [Natrialba chahannaoensis JCM 10990]|uniref:Uncharacterized protein n=1 Tax=Natrialba chahannaoensis JCM 10990 TaxID=1227492 RepID=M0B989_9EURY|nr:hypothetical protein [Natrialba chahannaoensis]ELZ06224.1 hypothetical protein C482_00340 [Natrialba chahannaoensis JCM 10990]